MPRDNLGSLGLWAYSVGHFMNDLVACNWFCYLTYYLQKVVKLSPRLSAGA